MSRVGPARPVLSNRDDDVDDKTPGSPVKRVAASVPVAGVGLQAIVGEKRKEIEHDDDNDNDPTLPRLPPAKMAKEDGKPAAAAAMRGAANPAATDRAAPSSVRGPAKLAASATDKAYSGVRLGKLSFKKKATDESTANKSAAATFEARLNERCKAKSDKFAMHTGNDGAADKRQN
jgi:hypothetical protein